MNRDEFEGIFVKLVVGLTSEEIVLRHSELLLDCSGHRGLEIGIETCTKMIELDPSDAEAFKWRAFWFRETGDLDRAIADLSEAIRIGSKEEPFLRSVREELYRSKRH